jgi:hypothetical protein
LVKGILSIPYGVLLITLKSVHNIWGFKCWINYRYLCKFVKRLSTFD